MDSIEFRIEDKKYGPPEFKIASVFINGTNLVDLLREYETPFASKVGHASLAGAYEGLEPERLYAYLSDPEEQDSEGKVSVLDCDCGTEGCWPMRVKILDMGDRVIWTDFEQPCRSSESNNFWDYTDFGEFDFDKEEYNVQLDILMRSIDTE